MILGKEDEFASVEVVLDERFINVDQDVYSFLGDRDKLIQTTLPEMAQNAHGASQFPK